VQLNEACRLVAEEVGQVTWELVYQSRSGPPQQPWLEPDICERIEQLAVEQVHDVIIVPIGFISDHMEVLFDLDTEVKQTCEKLGMGCIRVPSVGIHPLFVRMVCDLLVERIQGRSERPAIGMLGPSHDVCPVDCCLYPRPQRPALVSHSS
jgi:ferrochelatase